MNRSTLWEDEEITCKVGQNIVASFDGTYSGDLIEGAIDETYETKLTSAQLIELSQWLLAHAAIRSRDEAS